MKLQVILFLTSVTAGTVKAGLLDELSGPAMGVESRDEHPTDQDPRSVLALPLFGYDKYEDADCALRAIYAKVAGENGAPAVPPHCFDGRRLPGLEHGWLATKRQNGDQIREDIDNAIDDTVDRIEDANDRVDDYRDDYEDAIRNSAGCKTVSMMGVALLAVLSTLIMM